MKYLLDTNVCIALINGHIGSGPQTILKSSGIGEQICVPSVSVFELWYGVAKSVHTDANTKRLKLFLEGQTQLVEFGEEDVRRAGEIRDRLERMGKPIGTYDVLIAGQALARGFTLVTTNAREFARVKRLRWEDWGKG